MGTASVISCRNTGKIDQALQRIALGKFLPPRGCCSFVALRDQLDQLAPRAGQKLRTLGAQVDLGHRHVERRLIPLPDFLRPEAAWPSTVRRRQAMAPARLAILGVEYPAIPLIHPIPISHGVTPCLKA